MRVAIIGMGYVGTVSAACFAKLGTDVIGFDSNPKKIEYIRNGEGHIKEPQLDEFLQETVLHTKKLQVTTSFEEAIKTSDISMVCVGTPISVDGFLDTTYLENVCHSIADVLKEGHLNKKHIVVIRSSVVPGTVDKLKKIFLDKGLKYGEDFLIANNPELLREGTAVYDFMNPPHIIIGAEEQETADKIEAIYNGLDAEVIKASIKTIELIKLVNNAWHAVKLTFANEIASICRREGVDTSELLNLFCSDNVLNISKYYMERPSIGFGGSCLPKDLVALGRKAKDLELNCPLLDSVLNSNIEQIKRALKIVKEKSEKLKSKRVGFYGVAFKPGTDDIRGSPILYLINNLRLNGYDLKIFDPIIKKEQVENIRASYRGTINDPLMNNLLEIENFKDILPIIENHFISEDWVLDNDIIIMNTRIPLSSLLKLREDQTLIDMQGSTPLEDIKQTKAKYISIVKPEKEIKTNLQGKMKAVILCSGEGHRMRPLTYETPKALIKVNGKPIIEHLIELFKKHGVYEIFISVYHLKNQIKEYLGDGEKFGVKIKYIDEESLSGTAGPIKKISSELNESFFVSNGDELKDIDLSEIFEVHKQSRSKATIALTEVEDPSAYGVAIIEEDKIVEFVEKPSKETAPSNLINTGLYIFEPEILQEIPEGFSMLERDVFQKIARERQLNSYKFKGQWFDTGTFERYENAIKNWKGVS